MIFVEQTRDLVKAIIKNHPYKRRSVDIGVTALFYAADPIPAQLQF